MATLQNFDAEIEKTKRTVEEMRSKIEQSGIVLEGLAKADKKIGEADFDIENARIEDVLRQQKTMEGNIADLIIGLEDATNVFGAEFESMKSYTGWENFVGIFSQQRKQRMRTERVRNMSLAGNLQELLAESQTLERYTSMFQTFVDSLNNQIAAQNTLINKLTIDTEQRIVLYKALEDSLKTAAQQDVAHKINTLGSQVDTAAEETMAGIGSAAQRHIGDLLEMHEKNMLSTQDIQRRKKLADDAFARRFRAVLDKHNSANYVKQ